MRCAENGDTDLAVLEACSRRKEHLSLEEPLFLRRKLPAASFLISGSLESGVSNGVLHFGGRYGEDVSLEFGGVAGRSGRMEGSDLVHLYFFSRNLNTSVLKLLLLLLDVIKKIQWDILEMKKFWNKICLYFFKMKMIV